VQKRCEQLGLTLTRQQLDDAYRRMIALADERKVVSDDDLRQIVEAACGTAKAAGREAVTHEAGYRFGV
jgi:isopropylmalate/homocitrate/citramalate synthase